MQPQWKFVPYDWEDALRLPGAWDVGPAQALLAREDDEVRVAASGAAIVAYMPHAYDLALLVVASRQSAGPAGLEKLALLICSCSTVVL